MTKKRSKALIVSTILGAIYAIYLIVYFGNASSEDIGGAIASTIVMPHMICVVIAAAFNLAGSLTNKRGFALTSAILYSVSAVLFLMYAFFVIPMIILTFVGFANLKKINGQCEIKAERGAL